MLNSSVLKLLKKQNHSKLLDTFQNKILKKTIHQTIQLRYNGRSSFVDCNRSSNDNMRVACKTALVNGGTSGIGLAAAIQLLNAGARHVIVTGDNLCKGKEAALCLNNAFGKGKSMYIQCNVNSMGQYEDAFKKTYEKYRKLDIVVNAVGICDGEKWEREVVTNIVGTIRGTLLAYRYMGREGLGSGGCIVNISGISGLEALPSAPTLSASQHAIVGLSRSFGNPMHSKKSGVRVVCLCPGFTKTNFLNNIGRKGMTNFMGKHLERIISKSKMQKPDACGQAVVHIIENGSNGSVWLCEGSRLFLLNIPATNSYSTLVAQYI